MKKVLTVVLLVSAIMVASNHQASAQKMGYISMEDVIEAMPEAKKADSTLRQYQEALISNARDKETALNEAIQKFNADSAKFTNAVKDVKRKELQEKLTDLGGEEQRIREALQKKQQELSIPIQKKAMDAINAVAKENGYTYVFHKEGLLVSPAGDDLMPLVRKKLGLK